VQKTKIEWTDFSVSPVRARNKKTGKVFHWCEKVSLGCVHCYAETMARRFGLPEYVRRNRDKVEFFLDEDVLRKITAARRPRRVFVEDCSDLFGDWVPDEWLDKCFATFAFNQRHVFQVLTKRAERMKSYISGLGQSYARLDAAGRSLGLGLTFDGLSLVPWPIPNVWLGVSTEDQSTYNHRVAHLVQTPAAVRFLSCEPLLGPIDLRLDRPMASPFARDRISWCIVGGESGGGARPCQVNDVRNIVRQCRAASVPVFVKQDSGPRPGKQGRIPDELWRMKELPEHAMVPV
jgi:protein gp37